MNEGVLFRDGYGGVIRRTGMGEVPEPITGFAAVGESLQPAIFSTVMLTSPAVVLGIDPSWTSLMKACMNPTMVTPFGVALKVVGSMIGIVTIELLVVTRFPFCGPLWALN